MHMAFSGVIVAVWAVAGLGLKKAVRGEALEGFPAFMLCVVQWTGEVANRCVSARFFVDN